MMATDTISNYYAEDHTRLDDLFDRFLKEKETDLKKAIGILEEFKSGLEQHMAWEEAILFSEYDVRIPSPEGESPTVDLIFEHEQIRGYLETVLHKLRENDRTTDKDEARLAETLAAHNWAEETGLYLKLDEVLSDEDRSEIQKRMKDSTLA